MIIGITLLVTSGVLWIREALVAPGNRHRACTVFFFFSFFPPIPKWLPRPLAHYTYTCICISLLFMCVNYILQYMI
jgi:hypothetical protein